MTRGARRASWPLVAAAAVGGIGELVRRRRSAHATPPATPPPPPLTTQSSPGQIADLQQAFGADMGPPSGA
ncbi:MAG TPA: hypothetical protein VGN29_08165, partial [Solirubrobacteraceae bacterium]|nr:hypothetical protein [Solirubrobacteraceae bacterium]